MARKYFATQIRASIQHTSLDGHSLLTATTALGKVTFLFNQTVTRLISEKLRSWSTSSTCRYRSILTSLYRQPKQQGLRDKSIRNVLSEITKVNVPIVS